MLVLSLVLLALLLLIANGVVRSRRFTIAMSVCLLFVCATGSYVPTWVVPAVVLQCLVLFGLVIATRVPKRSPTFLLKLSSVGLLAALECSGLMLRHSEGEYSRGSDPFVRKSPKRSGPAPKPASIAPSLTVQESVVEVERAIRSATETGYTDDELLELHEETYDWFVNNQAFGFARMTPPRQVRLYRTWSGVPLVPDSHFRSSAAPGSPDAPVTPVKRGTRTGEPQRKNAAAARKGTPAEHRSRERSGDSLWFRRLFGATRWQPAGLELVGLLLDHEPRVYITERLPRMETLHDVPTRPLDSFERDALYKLNRGDDLVSAPKGSALRMLGAVRSTKQCLACHVGKPGDLLGAFSYTLRPDDSTNDGRPAQNP